MKCCFLVLLSVLLSTSAFAECWKDVLPGQHSKELTCHFQDWHRTPSRENLKKLLNSLFYVYLTDGLNQSMKKFFEGMKNPDSRFSDAFAYRQAIIAKYTFSDSEISETAALWAMQPNDAKMLFILSQTDPYSVPMEITCAMYMTVYDEIERYFYLHSFRQNSFAIFPAHEYVRLQEILRRMNWMNDPFLKSMNLIYQGLVSLNLRSKSKALQFVSNSKETLTSLLKNVSETLSKKRILRTRALANVILGELLQAESDYFAILKIDPEDWSALLDISYLLNKRGECLERGIWIEALLLKDETQFEIVIHCGNQNYPEEFFPTELPAIAYLRN